MDAEEDKPRCPSCWGPLVCIGGTEVGIGGTDYARRHAYSCPAGCLGPEPDRTFAFIECPACGRHDTSSTPRGDGAEEVVCNACGTIATIQIVPSSS